MTRRSRPVLGPMGGATASVIKRRREHREKMRRVNRPAHSVSAQLSIDTSLSATSSHPASRSLHPLTKRTPMRMVFGGQHGERAPRETAGVCVALCGWYLSYPKLAGENRALAPVAARPVQPYGCPVTRVSSVGKSGKKEKLRGIRGDALVRPPTLPHERHPHGIRDPALCTCPPVRAQHTTASGARGLVHRVLGSRSRALRASQTTPTGSWIPRAKSAIQSRTWAVSSETPTSVAAVTE